MSTRREKLAIAFAKSHGFDGVEAVSFENSEASFENDSYYEACVLHDTDLWPLFDETPHIIIVNDTEARWRSEDDAIDLNH